MAVIPMNNVQKVVAIRHRLSNLPVEFLHYRIVGNPLEIVEKTCVEIMHTIGRVKVVDFNDKVCQYLGFQRWEDTVVDIRLIPLFLYPFLAHDQELIDILGNKILVTENYWKAGLIGYIDCDNNNGFLGYGFVPKD